MSNKDTEVKEKKIKKIIDCPRRFETVGEAVRYEVIQELKGILEYDSCECDNCKILRNYVKNPKKEVHRRTQQLKALMNNYQSLP